MKTEGYIVEHDSENTICIVPTDWIEISEFFSLLEMYRELEYKFVYPADARGGMILSKSSLQWD